MLENNVGFFFISSNMISDGVIRSDNKGSESLFPLYIYQNIGEQNLFNDSKPLKRKPNINNLLYDKIERSFREKPNPEQILYYIYGIVYSTVYRAKYKQFLKTDFPRVPFTNDYELFREIEKLGEKLIDLHLLRSVQLSSPVSRFQGEGTNKIAKPKRVGRNYKAKEGCVYINKDGQHFEGIKPEVWEYEIGGYQVLDKWLKDRRERKLSLSEIKTYCKIVTAIEQTIEVQQKIDEIYPAVEENTIDLKLESN